MENLDSLLYQVSAGFSVLMVLMVIVPYLLGRSDLVTTFNMFLGGSFIFIGLSGMSSAELMHYKWYPSEVFYKYFIGLAVFYSILFLSYYLLRFPGRLAGRNLLTWPSVTTSSMFILAIVAAIIGTLALFPIPFPFVSQLQFQFFVRCGPFAVVFAMAAIRRDKSNPVLWGTLVAILAAMLLTSMAFGGGRRFALSLLLVIPIYIYWVWLRYKPAVVAMVLLGIGAVGSFIFMEAFDTVRHRTTDAERGVDRAFESLKLTGRGGKERTFDVKRFSQNSVETTLFTIFLYESRDSQFEKSLFHAPFFVLVNPIPRTFWKGKPKSFGYTLPMVVGLKVGMKGYRKVNWGVSPVGQGYHDGGLWVIAIYAFGIAFCLRFFDDLLLRQPDNPFLLGFLGAASGHIIALPRGGIDVMSINIIACTITLLLLGFAGRLFLGSGISYPRTDQLVGLTRIKALGMTQRKQLS